MATTRPNKPNTQNNRSRNNRVSRPNPVKDVKAEKKAIKEDLRRKIELELYKLNQDVIIQRMGVRDELFGDNNDLDDLRKSMEKFEEERLKKENEDKDKSNKPDKSNNRPKMDIKLKLIKREE